MDILTIPTNVTEITTAQSATTTAEPVRTMAARYLWALTRLCLGWTFLWPFLDKTFGLGRWWTQTSLVRRFPWVA